MTAYSFLQHLHSGFRYIVLALILAAIIGALIGWIGQKPYTNGIRKLNLFALISAHTQLLIGIILYFISPLVQFTSDTMKNPVSRYFTVEHWVMMIIAIVLITIGHSKSKKAATAEAKHKVIAILYFIALLIILVGIILIPRS
jgi:membrane protein DedA with SNARE-associated domain